MIIVCVVVIAASIIANVFDIQVFKSNAGKENKESKGMVEENGKDNKGAGENTESQGCKSNPIPEEELIPEFEATARISFLNTKKIDSMIPLKGHSHLVADTQKFLNENQLEGIKELSVIEDSLKYDKSQGNTTFKCRLDKTTNILKIIYGEHKDLFSFELQ